MAVVLCGGQSTRMGKDKGLLMANDKTWAELQVEKLQNIGVFDAVICSVNESQLCEYSKKFDRKSLIVDHIDVAGPLKGILSAHINYPNHHLLIIACDMQNIGIDMIELLIKNDINASDAVVFQQENGDFEPLLGIYKGVFLANIIKMHLVGKLYKYSMQSILSMGKICIVKLTNNQIEYFKNFNSLHDLT